MKLYEILVNHRNATLRASIRSSNKCRNSGIFHREILWSQHVADIRAFDVAAHYAKEFKDE